MSMDLIALWLGRVGMVLAALVLLATAIEQTVVFSVSTFKLLYHFIAFLIERHRDRAR